MNLEQVYVENCQSTPQRNPLRANKSTTFPPKPADPGYETRLKKAAIERILVKLTDKGLVDVDKFEIIDLFV